MRTFERIGSERIDAVMELIARAINRLNELGIPQWDEIYPDRKTLERDIGEGSLFGMIVDGNLAAIVALNHFQDAEYSQVDWSIDDPRPLVVHRLCVDPAYQGLGLAKEAVAFAERTATERGCASIRLDAFTLNPISLSLYRSLGFADRGVVRFRKGLFVCFERLTRRQGER